MFMMSAMLRLGAPPPPAKKGADIEAWLELGDGFTGGSAFTKGVSHPGGSAFVGGSAGGGPTKGGPFSKGVRHPGGSCLTFGSAFTGGPPGGGPAGTAFRNGAGGNFTFGGSFTGGPGLLRLDASGSLPLGGDFPAGGIPLPETAGLRLLGGVLTGSGNAVLGTEPSRVRLSGLGAFLCGGPSIAKALRALLVAGTGGGPINPPADHGPSLGAIGLPLSLSFHPAAFPSVVKCGGIFLEVVATTGGSLPTASRSAPADMRLPAGSES